MKTILVTGASRGIGLGFVKAGLDKGYRVIATCRNPEKAVGLEKLKSKNLFVIKMDITEERSISRAAGEIGRLTSGLDILINNAGVNSKTLSPSNPGSTRVLAELNVNTLLEMFKINTISPLLVIRNFLGLLGKSTHPVIVNISSQRASFSDVSGSANYGYSASKVALNMFIKELAFELQDSKILTFAVHPGSVLTEMNPHGDISPEEAGSKIIEVARNFTKEQNGKFLDNEGNLFPL